MSINILIFLNQIMGIFLGHHTHYGLWHVLLFPNLLIKFVQTSFAVFSSSGERLFCWASSACSNLSCVPRYLPCSWKIKPILYKNKNKIFYNTNWFYIDFSFSDTLIWFSTCYYLHQTLPQHIFLWQIIPFFFQLKFNHFFAQFESDI